MILFPWGVFIGAVIFMIVAGVRSKRKHFSDIPLDEVKLAAAKIVAAIPPALVPTLVSEINTLGLHLDSLDFHIDKGAKSP